MPVRSTFSPGQRPSAMPRYTAAKTTRTRPVKRVGSCRRRGGQRCSRSDVGEYFGDAVLGVRGAEQHQEQEPRLGSLEIAGEDRAGVGEILAAALAVDRLDPAGRAARSD